MANDADDSVNAVTIEIGWKAGLAFVLVLVAAVGAFLVWPRLQANQAASGGESSPTTVLAKVGTREITERDVEVMFLIQKTLAESAGKQLASDPATVRAVKRDMLDQLVDTALLADAAKAAGLTISPASVEAEMAPVLASQNIKLDAAKAQLAAAGVTDADFQAWGAEQLLLSHYMQTPDAQAKGRETLKKRGMPEAMLAQAQVQSADVASTLQETADIRFYLMDKTNGSPPVREGQPAPDFTVTDVDGKPVALSSLRGKPLMVNFWATWCGPCKIEMPIYASAYTANKDKGLQVLALDVQEGADQVKSFLATNSLPFPVALDADGSVATIYRVRGLPTTVFIDADGIVQSVHRGAIQTAADLTPPLQAILPGAQVGEAPAVTVP